MRALRPLFRVEQPPQIARALPAQFQSGLFHLLRVLQSFQQEIAAGYSHEDPQRGAAVRVLHLRQEVPHQRQFKEAPRHPHGRPTAQVPSMRQIIFTGPIIRSGRKYRQKGVSKEAQVPRDRARTADF